MTQPGGLAARLFRMREATGLSQLQLAERLGWGPRSGPPKISKLENGRQMPSANDVRLWADATGNTDSIPELLAMLADIQAVHVRRRKLLQQGEAPLQEEYDQRIQAATHIQHGDRRHSWFVADRAIRQKHSRTGAGCVRDL